MTLVKKDFSIWTGFMWPGTEINNMLYILFQNIALYGRMTDKLERIWKEEFMILFG